MKFQKRTIKVLSLSVLCLITVLTFALIPINLFCADFPEWVTLVLSAIVCCGLIAYLVIFKTKLITKIVLPIIFGIIVFLCSFVPYLFPYWNSYVFKDYRGVILNYNEVVSYKAAKEDMNALKAHLKRTHPMFADGLTEEIERAFGSSLARLSDAEEITVNDLRREIQTILHLMGDAHTTTYNSYPDDAYLKVSPQKTAEGYAVKSINGVTVGQIYENAKPYYCYETEEWISIDLGSLATLDFLGYSEPFTYQRSNGESEIEETYSADDFVGWNDYLEISKEYDRAEERQEFVYYDIDEQKNLAVLTLTQCVYNQTYIDCVKQMFTEIKRKGIENVAVDLRGNGGGSSLVGNEFVKYLPVDRYFDVGFDWRWNFITIHSDQVEIANERKKELTFDGEVYILTDSGSFSSAKDFAMLIQDNRLGKIIGEPSANSVNGYGDVTYFYLPNTGLFVQISTKKWYRIDGGNTDDYVMPDYPCKSDDCLEKLYEIIS